MIRQNTKGIKFLGGLAACIVLCICGNSIAIPQEKPGTVRAKSEFRSSEAEEEFKSAEYLNDMGGDLAKKFIAQNPDLFPQSLSPLERARRLEFFLPRADHNGFVDLDLNVKAWQELESRKQLQFEKSSSINGSRATSLLSWSSMGPRDAVFS